VPRARDTRLKYDSHPISDGPYMVESYEPSRSLQLVRNPHWEPATDPVRTAYPDEIEVNFGIDPASASDEVISDSGPGRTAVTWDNLGAQARTSLSPADKEREVTGPTSFVDYFGINLDRVTDPNVRKAMNMAVDKVAALQAVGAAGTPLNTILPPTTFGWQDYDPFGVGTRGDPAKAKALLHGARPALTLCYPNTAPRTQEANVVRQSLAAAGFQVTLKQFATGDYYAAITDRGNICDLYRFGWGLDWPSSGSMLSEVFDGRLITQMNNQNVSFYNNPVVNQELDRIAGESDMVKAAADWAALDKKIMTEDAPIIPIFDYRNDTIVGSNVGGAYLSIAYSVTSLDTIYVKSGG
jgi:peptide/nickel transport system substrate-binding protein